jgi:hypothetical protein
MNNVVATLFGTDVFNLKGEGDMMVQDIPEKPFPFTKVILTFFHAALLVLFFTL